VGGGVECHGVRNRNRRFLKALLGALLLFVPVLLIILLNVNAITWIHPIVPHQLMIPSNSNGPSLFIELPPIGFLPEPHELVGDCVFLVQQDNPAEIDTFDHDFEVLIELEKLALIRPEILQMLSLLIQLQKQSHFLLLS